MDEHSPRNNEGSIQKPKPIACVGKKQEQKAPQIKAKHREPHRFLTMKNAMSSGTNTGSTTGTATATSTNVPTTWKPICSASNSASGSCLMVDRVCEWGVEARCVVRVSGERVMRSCFYSAVMRSRF